MNRNAKLDAVAEEVAGAKAEALGLAGKKLEDAVRALRELYARPEPRDAVARARLVADATQRTLAFLVQREAHGLLDAAYALKFYAVPAEIAARLGIRE
jgi:hypothetical protein